MMSFPKHILFVGQYPNRESSRFEYRPLIRCKTSLLEDGFCQMSKVSKPNDSVFQIKLIKPFPAFLGLMTMKYASVVPKEIAEHYGSDFRSHNRDRSSNSNYGKKM
jgi:peptide/nickel transport system substrate-binding protein